MGAPASAAAAGTGCQKAGQVEATFIVSQNCTCSQSFRFSGSLEKKDISSFPLHNPISC